jgi:hypothetical protein
MAQAFRKVLERFNAFLPEHIFNAPELAKELNVTTRKVHSFLTPAKYMGIIIKRNIKNPKKGHSAARMEYLKVRSLTSEEIDTISDRLELVDFIRDLQRINKVWEKTTGKEKVKKMLVKQNVTRLTDSDISKICNVPKAFISKLRSDLPIDNSRYSLSKHVPKPIEVQKDERILKMPDDSKKLTYGRPLMKKLTEQANDLGNTVSFHINENAKYVINDGTKLHRPPTAVTACHFMMGIIAASKTLKV